MGRKNKTNYGKQQKTTNTLLIVMVLLLIGIGVGALAIFGGDKPGLSLDGTGGDGDELIIDFKDSTTSLTTYLNSYTGTWGNAGSKTEVYPVYTVTEGTDVRVSDAVANSTTTSIDKTLMVYGTGATYYVEPKEETVEQANQIIELKAQTIVATSDLVWSCYADDGTTALTADDNDSNTADYAGGAIGASQDYTYYCKLKNNVADKTFRLGAILVYHCGDEVDDFKLNDPRFKAGSLPSGDLTKSFTHYDDTNASTSCSIKRVYEVKDSDYIELQEWTDTGKMPFVLEAGSSQPTANGDSYIGVIAVDYSYELDEDGIVAGDWYKHDNSNDADDIGLSEGVIASGYNGLDVGFCIEPQ